MTNQKLRQAALCLALLTAPAIGNMAHASSRYDAVKDFSIKSNPNGVWTYMDSAPLAYAHRKYESVKGLFNWSDDIAYPNGASIILNKTGATVSLDDGTTNLPTDYLALDAEATGADLRFTAPTAGSFAINLEALGLNTDEQHRSAIILYHNKNAFFSFRLGSNRHRRHKFTMTMAVGDTLDFLDVRNKPGRPDYIGVAVKITGP